MTSHSEVNERFLKCLRGLFPECTIDVVLKEREDPVNFPVDAEGPLAGRKDEALNSQKRDEG
jgi:hypothetical protein